MVSEDKAKELIQVLAAGFLQRIVVQDPMRDPKSRSLASHRIESSRRIPQHKQAVWKLDILIEAPDIAGSRIAHGLRQWLGIFQLLQQQHPGVSCSAHAYGRGPHSIAFAGREVTVNAAQKCFKTMHMPSLTQHCQECLQEHLLLQWLPFLASAQEV